MQRYLERLVNEAKYNLLNTPIPKKITDVRELIDGFAVVYKYLDDGAEHESLFFIVQCPRCYCVFTTQNKSNPVCMCTIKSKYRDFRDSRMNDTWPVFVAYTDSGSNGAGGQPILDRNTLIVFPDEEIARNAVREIMSDKSVNKPKILGMYSENPHREGFGCSCVYWWKDDGEGDK